MTAEDSGRSGFVSVREAASSDDGTLSLHRSASDQESSRYRGYMMDVAGSESVDAGSRVAYVAEIAGEVVGSLVAGELSDGAWMILSVHTVEGARGVGVGDALMERFCSAAGERGARRLLSRALPGDRETKNLFERHGFTAQMIVLGSDPTPEH